MKRLLKKPKIAIFRCAIIIASFATLFSFGLPVFAQEGPDQRAEGSPFLVPDDNSLQTSNADGTYNSNPNESATNETVQAVTDVFELILKVLYLLLWPLLAIAGASMDNTLVYGDIFYLDKALWQFWQMIRTFANFALGFIFIASIIISFFGAEKKFEKISVKTIIKKLFLAGVLINMSRFIVAALLDLSTVLVFSLGAMPLNVIREDVQTEQGLGKVRYLSSHSFYNQDTSLNTSRDQVEHSIVYSCPGQDAAYDPNGPNQESQEYYDTIYYVPCKVQANKLPPNGAEDENQTRENRKQQYVDAWGEIGNGEIGGKISDDYCVWGYDLIKMEANAELTAEKVKELRDAAKRELKSGNCSTIDKLIEKAKGMTGPLYTLYATILHMGEVGVTINNKTVVEKGLEFLMRAVVALALFLPLVALAVVLVVRAVILWLVIAFSPLLVLIYVFGFKTFGGEKSELKSIIGLIFLPVFAVFAVSMSILFLSLIGRIELIDDTNSCKVDTFSRLTGAGVECPEENQKCYSLFNITKICFTESQSNTGSNIISTLSWLTVNFFGVALMRTIIFFVLKSDKITGGIAGKIEAFGKGLAGSTPIIPLPMGMTSLGALNQARKDMESAPERLASQQFNQGLGEYMESYGARKDAKQVDQGLADKVKQASQGQTVSFAPDRDFSLPDNTNYKQYPSIGPSLGLASGKKTYAQAKGMSFQDAYSDPNTIEYMQKNSLYTTDTWVKNDGDMGRNEKIKLARNMEIALASKGTALGRDSLDGNATRYMLGDYVTQFPWGDSAKGRLKNNADIKNINVPAKPTKKTDWDSFASFFTDASVAGIRRNPEFITAYAEYMGLLVPGATTTWIDKLTDPANHKTYTITTNVDGANNIVGFQLT